MADFPISIEVDPGASLPVIDSVDRALQKLPKTQKIVVEIDAHYEQQRQQLQQQVDQLRLLSQGRSTDAELLAFENGLRAEGLSLGAQERAQLGALIGEREVYQVIAARDAQLKEQEIGILQRLRGPMQQYQNDIAALNRLLERGAISQEEFALQAKRTESALARSQAPSAPGGAGAEVGEALQGAIPLASAAGAVAGAAILAVKVKDLSDEYTTLQNKLRQVTSSDQELADVQQHLFETSNATGTAVNDLASIYQRTIAATQTLGVSARTTRGFVDELAKIVAYSGVSSTEAAQGLIQLSQGLGRGVLQGQDLKAVLEDVPEIGRQIAAGLGVPVAKLRELGEQGKLTATDIISALAASGDAVDEKFAKRIPTADQAMTQLHNAFEQLVGQLAVGLGPALVGVVGVISDVVKSLEPAIAAGVKLFEIFGAPVFKLLAGYLELSAKALGLVGSIVGTILGPIGQLVGLVSDLIGGIGDLAGGVLSDLGDAASSVGDAVADALGGKVDFDKMKAINDIIEKSNAAFAKQAEILADLNEKIPQINAYNAEFAALQDQIAKKSAADAEQRAEDIRYVARELLRGGEVDHDTLQQFVTDSTDASEAAKAHAKELEKLVDTVDAGGKAQKDFLHYQELLTEALADGKLTTDQASLALQQYKEAHEDALDPVGALAGKIADHIAALGTEENQNSASALAQKYTNQLRKEGVIIDADLAQTIDALSLAEAEAIKKHEQHAKSAKQGADALKSLENELFPTIKAHKDLEIATRDLDVMVKRHIITRDEATDGLKRYKIAHDEILDPIEHEIRQLKEKTAELHAVTQQEKDLLEIEKFIADQAQKGTFRGNEYEGRRKALHDLSDAYRDLRDAQNEALSLPTVPETTDDFLKEATERTTGLTEATLRYYAVEKQLNDELAHGQITHEEFVFLLERAQAEIGSAKPAGTFFKSFNAQVYEGLQDFKKQFLDTSQLVGSTMSDAFKGVEDAFVSLVTTGKASFGDLFKSLEADIARLAFRLAAIKLIGAIAPGGSFGAAAAGIPLLGFANGGDFTVGGDGGIDRNVVMFRATRGEHVSVRTPDQREQVSGGGGGVVYLQPTIINRLNGFDSVESMDTPRGRKVYANMIQRMPEQISRLNRG